MYETVWTREIASLCVYLSGNQAAIPWFPAIDNAQLLDMMPNRTHESIGASLMLLKVILELTERVVPDMPLQLRPVLYRDLALLMQQSACAS